MEDACIIDEDVEQSFPVLNVSYRGHDARFICDVERNRHHIRPFSR